MTAGPGYYPLALYRGDSYAWRFRVWTDLDYLVPVDLAGATAAAQLRDRPGGTTILDMACTVTAPNEIAVQLDAADWPAVVRQAAWDLQVTFPDARVWTVVAGPVTVAADVTVP